MLLVEDDENIREMYQMKLEMEGYKVITAGDGKEASELIKKEKLDLVLLDILLSKKDGFEVLEEIRRSKSESVKNIPDELSALLTTFMSLINIKNVSVIYNEGLSNQMNALLDTSLEIETEEYIIIFGPSGCGKSTLLNVIAEMEKTTQGEVYIDEENLDEMDADRLAKFHCVKIGMIFQAYNILPSLSVRDNIILPQMFLGKNSGSFFLGGGKSN